MTKSQEGMHTGGHKLQRPRCMERGTESLTIDVEHADHGDSMGVLANRAVDFVDKPVEQAGVEGLGQGIPVVYRCLDINRTDNRSCTAGQSWARKQEQQTISANSSRQPV